MKKVCSHLNVYLNIPWYMLFNSSSHISSSKPWWVRFDNRCCQKSYIWNVAKWQSKWNFKCMHSTNFINFLLLYHGSTSIYLTLHYTLPRLYFTPFFTTSESGRMWQSGEDRPLLSGITINLIIIITRKKTIKNEKRCRNAVPKSTRTRIKVMVYSGSELHMVY